MDRIVARARQVLSKLRRFQALTTEIKRQLYLTIVRPILEYPSVPLHSMSTNSIKKLQRVQNKATRFITNTNLTDFVPSQQLHEQCRIEPINQRLHHRAKKLWDSIGTCNYPMLQRLMQQNLGNKTSMRFPQSLGKIDNNAPEPIF